MQCSICEADQSNQVDMYCLATGAPDVRFGYIPESPWSSGIIRADVSNPAFKGMIKYEFRSDVPASYIANGYDPMDQRWGEFVRVSLFTWFSHQLAAGPI